MISLNKLLYALLCVHFVGEYVTARADETPGPAFVPYHSSGIYKLGETVGWNVTLPGDAAPVTYVIRKNNLETIGSGAFQPGRPGRIEVQSNELGNEAGMVYVEIVGNSPGAPKKALGAAVAPEKIGASIPAPQDFDAFWTGKIRMLRNIPPHPVLTHRPSDKDGVDFAVLRLDQLEGRHVWAQVASPHDESGKQKYPALVMFEWGGPHFLPKATVTDRAAEGWLAVNVEPHDAMPDQPQSYYAALPESLQHFEMSGPHDRDHYFLLYMFLGNIRVLDYLASRPDWDGKTLVVTGTSLGGQQALCAAGLNPRVTAVLALVPAGADANGVAHGRQVGWPWLGRSDPQELQTGQYFDTVNCATHIKAPTLMAFGFIDTLTPPVGNWAAFNAIQGPKEAASMRDSPHVYLATPEQLLPWTERSVAWLGALRTGRPPIGLATH
jgi:cephalosporin-C deacetylase